MALSSWNINSAQKSFSSRGINLSNVLCTVEDIKKGLGRFE